MQSNDTNKPAPAARRFSWVCLLALAVAAGACSASGRAPEPAPDGAALFGQACAKCHAADGSGGLPTVANGPRPADLRAAEWQRGRTDSEITAAIRNGRGAMPPFQDVLTTAQIEAVAAYVRTLKRE